MARYGTAIESQTAMAAGLPVTTTVNGYIGYIGASATAGFKLRRCTLGIRCTGTPTSAQMTVKAFRQTVAPVGTGIAAAVAGETYEIHVPVDPTAGLFATTATVIGTSGPTLNANPIKEWTLNTQNTVDIPIEFLEELIVNKGTANGIAFVNIGAALPASHLFTIECAWEV